jgi:hypothetical protein
MNRIKTKYIIAAAVAVLAVGYWAGSAAQNDTIIPHPIQKRSRLKTVARIARTALWFLTFADAGQTEGRAYVHNHNPETENSVDHYEGW